MIVVLSLGGSLINRKDGINYEYLKRIMKILIKSRYKFGIVTGGGYKAREYANDIRKKGGNEFEADRAVLKQQKKTHWP